MIAVTFFTKLDWAVLIGYFIAIMAIGVFFWRRNQSSEEFTAAGGTLSGWLCGLSIFATYLSSISYLALPGKAFVDNWNAFAFSLALPPAAWIAVRYFLPMYRESGEVSAYSLLENRFGLWARLFASAFYLLFQVARIGVVMYLMALPMAVLFGWDIRTVILVTGVVVTVYAFIGGITAVIWADAIQAIVLLGGAVLVLGILMFGIPGGPSFIFESALSADKFSLGETSVTLLNKPTVWVILAYGLFENLKNFGIDQSYVQRYIASRSDREAAKSIWLGALLYVPVSALFFLIGTSLFVFYENRPVDLDQVAEIVARQRLMQDGITEASADFPNQLVEMKMSLKNSELGDRVFPHFIASRLPTGVRGLLIAAIFAAAMSTVSTSLNSAATLVMSDFYVRLIKSDADDRSRLGVLRVATLVWGALGTAMALVLVRLTDSILDVWWALSGVLGAAIIGLFLLGITSPRLRGSAAKGILAVGVLVILWMTLSLTDYWPESLARFKSPFHVNLVIVLGPMVMMLLGRIMQAGSRGAAAVLVVGFALLLPSELIADSPKESKATRPNIVFILVDDLAWSDLGCYGHPWHKTRHLDELAASGMRFTNGYAPAPICSASRASIMTGKTTARLGFEFVTKNAPGSQEIKASLPLSAPPFKLNLPLAEETIAECLAGGGYETAFFGKWHLNQHHGGYLGWSPSHGPRAQGFEIAEQDFGAHPYSWNKGKPKTSHENGQFPPDSMVDRVCSYLHRPKDKPFFLMASSFYVHTPVRTTCQWLVDQYDSVVPAGVANRDKRVTYAAFVQTLDHHVGKILEALDQSGRRDETFVILMSDNGGHPEFTGNAPLRGSKWNLYEGGIRVPLIASWPGKVAASSTCDQPVIGYDLLPTFADIAGASCCLVDGKSILPLLEGEPSMAERPLLWHFPYYHPENGFAGAKPSIGKDDFMVSQTRPQSAIRLGNQKLIWFAEDDRVELYDLDRSLSEGVPVSDPVRSEKLKATLKHELRVAGARMARPTGEDVTSPGTD